MSMLGKLGTTGAVGVLLVLVGIALVAWQEPVVAVGLAFAFAGVALIAKGLVSNALRAFGFA